MVKTPPPMEEGEFFAHWSRELRSHMLHGVAKKKKEFKNYFWKAFPVANSRLQGDRFALRYPFSVAVSAQMPPACGQGSLHKQGVGWITQDHSRGPACTHTALFSGLPPVVKGKPAGVCSWSAAQRQTLQPGASSGGPVSTDRPAETDPLPSVQLQVAFCF